MISIQPCDNAQEWDDYVLEHQGHPLQLWGWGEVKAAHNWHVERVVARNLDQQFVGAAQLLIRPLPWPFRALVYVPRGPVAAFEHREVVLEALANYAKSRHHAAVLTIEPDWADVPLVTGWRRSPHTILIPRTLMLDLSKTEDELLADMSKKTRQYIRKSAGEGIEIRRLHTHAEVNACLKIYHQTAKRAGFALHDDQYYIDIFDKLGDHSPIFAAFLDEQPLAFVWLAISRETAFELYGGMNDQGQQLRANYALKWHAIRTMKEWGVEVYDMNGLLNDGVSTFKQGFASHEDQLAGTYDRPLSPLYGVWMKLLPLAKRALRLIARR